MSKKKKKKIVLLIAGGTCLIDKQGHVLVIKEKLDIHNWLSQMPELSILADVEPIFIAAEDEIIGPSHWQEMAKVIMDQFMEADGFIVVSKIDSIIPTALALDFLIQHCQKTIIVTTSQISGTSFVDKKEIINKLKAKQGGLGLRANLINALQIADQPLPGPAIMFGTRLIPATKAIIEFGSEINSFASINGDYWGKVDFGVNVKSNLSYSSHRTEIYPKIAADILSIEDIPGVPWHFNKETLAKCQAVFIKVKPYQSLEDSKQKQIAKWNLPVVLYNYQSVVPVKGAVAISGCTDQTALIKTMWAVANQKKITRFY